MQETEWTIVMARQKNERHAAEPKTDNAVLDGLAARSRTAMRAVFLFSFCINVLTLIVPLFMLQVYDRVLPNHSLESLWVLVVICGIGLITMALLEAIRRTTLIKYGRWAEHQLGSHLLESAILRSVRRGEPNAAILQDATRFTRFLSGGTFVTALDTPWTPLFLAVIFSLHPTLGLMVIGGGLILIALAVAHERVTRASHESTDALSRTSEEMANHFVHNAEVIHAMGMYPALSNRWEAMNDRKLAAEHDAAMSSNRFQSFAKFVRVSLQLLVIAVAAVLIMRGELSAGAIIACVLLMRRAIAPLEQCIQSWKGIVEARSAFIRIREYLQRAPSLQPQQVMPDPAGAMVVKDLSYKFSSTAKSIFSRVDLEVPAGQSIAIVGDTGSGKSTFARILVGAKRAASGTVSLGGYDLSQWDPAQLGPHVGYLPQDVELFTGTILENISRMQEANLADVVDAARMAGVHEIIQRMPDGYGTEVGHAGSRLSGGQRQRIALARALYGRPRFVVLDEPDANLDADGTIALAMAIRRLKQDGAVVVLITHDTHIRDLVDHLYELRGGRLVEVHGPVKKGKSTPLMTVGSARDNKS